MLPIDKTFRAIKTSIWTGHKFVEASETDEPCNRLSVSPFENPWHLIGAPHTPNEAPSPADIDLLRAAYFATIPGVD